MNYGLSEIAQQKILSVFNLFPEIQEVIIFGSRAIGSYREGSDIDMAVKGNINFGKLLNICSKTEDLNLPYKFDILDYSKIKEPGLIEQIDKYGDVFYKK